MSSAAVASQGPESIQPQAPRRGRSAAEIPVDLHGADGPFPGITRNISREGAFIATHQPLPPGTRFLLFLVFPGDRKPLAVRAEVRWVREDAARIVLQGESGDVGSQELRLVPGSDVNVVRRER